ncbi:MAG: 8-hydroxy-5-deazaflavin:NADPH oxidoreductase [Chloroflexota bacterium]|jgi:NADPH-dependent F420 reductase|nr:8-hydroxy-5-deazaflavin:NADPH oxidoreductase [Chloroflexota bacterium]
MKIAIIGSGNVGRALATSFTRAGHQVVLASRDPEHAGEVAAATGARSASSSAEAAASAELVVLAIPFASAGDVATEIREAVAGKPVIDVTNRISFGTNGAEIDTSSSNAEEIAALLPDAKVVKAFNTLFAPSQADPILDGVQLDGFVAGDDLDAKRLVIALIDSIGLDPIDVGPLARARQLEGLAFLNMTLQMANNGAWRSAWKLVAAPSTVPVPA